MSKKIKIILTVSVLLNLVFIGFTGAHVFRFAQMRMMMNAPEAGLDNVIMKLPTDKAELFVRTVKDLESGRKDMFKNMKESRDAVRTAMLAEPFDADAVRKAFDKMETPRKNATEKIIALAEKLNVEERKLLVDYFEKSMVKPMKRALRHMKRPPDFRDRDDMLQPEENP